MSDVITTERINGHRLSIVLNHTRGLYHVYDLLLHTPSDDEPMRIVQSIFSGAPSRTNLVNNAIMEEENL